MKQKLKNFIKQNTWLLVTLAFIIVVFNVWSLSWGIISAQDWYFKYSDTAKSIFLQWPYLLNPDAFGTQNLTISNYPVLLLWGLLSTVFNFETIERFLYIFPSLIVGTIGSFTLIKYITHSKKAAFIGTLIYMLNSYVIVLAYAGHFTIFTAYALVPVAIYFIEKLITTQKYSYIISTAITLTVLGVYEFRILYIVTGLVIFRVAYYFFNSIHTLKHRIVTSLLVAVPFIWVLIFNLPWILGLYTTNSLTENSLFSQTLFGNQYLNLIYAFTINHPFWKGGEIVYFQNQTVLWTSFLFPLLAFATLFTKKNKRTMLFWAIVAVIGILLVKQVDMPFGGLYEWLFANFPGFSAFREASKFFVLITLSYAILISNLVSQELVINIKNKKYRIENILIFILLLVIAFVNAFPIFARRFDSNYQTQNIPKAYSEVKDFLDEDDSTFNTLWIPYQSNWSYFTKDKPALNFGNFFYDFVYTKYPKLPNYKDIFLPENKKYLTYLLESTGVKYIVLSKDREAYTEIGLEYDMVLKSFEGNKRFEKKSFGDLVTYKLTTAKPKLYTSADSYGIQSVEDLDKLMEFNKTVKDSNYLLQDVSYNNSKIADLGKLISEVSLIGSRFMTKDQIGEGTVKIYKRSDIQNLNARYIGDKLTLFTTPIGYIYKNGSELFNNINYENEILFETTLDPQANYFIQADQDYYLLTSGTLSLGTVGELNYPKQIKVIKTASQNNYVPSKRYLEKELGSIEKEEVYTYSFANPVKKYIDTIVSIDDIELNFNPTNFTNIFENGSFEKGLWQEQVSDCNNSDNNPILAMGLDSDTIHATQSARLEAQRHTACISTDINIRNAGHHLFSFWYKSENATDVGYYLSYGDNFIQRRIGVENKQWNNYHEYIQIPSGVTQARLTIYSYSTNDKDNIVTLYDDFRLYNVSEVKELYYVEEGSESTGAPNITVTKATPTKYEFQVSDFSKNFYLNFANNYSDNWELKVVEKGSGLKNKAYTVPVGNQQKSTIGLNIWRINVDNICYDLNCGNVDNSNNNIKMILEYKPQRLVNTLYTINILIITATIGYLFFRRYYPFSSNTFSQFHRPCIK